MQMYSLVMNTSLNSITWGWRSILWFKISASTYLHNNSTGKRETTRFSHCTCVRSCRWELTELLGCRLGFTTVKHC